MEITLRTPQGIEAISMVRKACPDMLVGAGTVLSIENARKAIDAGAQYIVSPGLDTKLVEWCLSKDIPVIPGCVTPTEVSAAQGYSLDVLKFFPADIYGGVKGCKALHAPFNKVSFIPTGGICNDNLADYADKTFIHAIGGGWLCQSADINARNFEAISNGAAKAISVLLGFELAHVGINADSDGEARSVADRFCNGFGLDLKEGSTSYFTGGIVEINKSKGRGGMGHIAMKTNNVDRAIHYLQKKGFSPDWSSRKNTKDRTTLIYLTDEIGGFAVHLLQK
jgi:2-dehydro-3-deoxyphosphogluconate aldolase/(4S)-4-hydroxy-2-oxoglutarate aldolase